MAGGHHVALLCSLIIVLVTSVDTRFAGGVDPGFAHYPRDKSDGYAANGLLKPSVTPSQRSAKVLPGAKDNDPKSTSSADGRTPLRLTPKQSESCDRHRLRKCGTRTVHPDRARGGLMARNALMPRGRPGRVVFIDASMATIPKGFNIRGRLRISRDAGFFTSDLSQLSGQWQTVDAKRNAECPQKCLDAGFSYAAMQTQTNRGWCKCARQLNNIEQATRKEVMRGDIQVLNLQAIKQRRLQVIQLAKLHRQVAIASYKIIMKNPKWYRFVTVTTVPSAYGLRIGMTRSPSVCFKRCAAGSFNYAFYSVYGCFCSNDKSDVKVVRPQYRKLNYFAAGRTCLFYISRVNRLKPSGTAAVIKGRKGYLILRSPNGRVQTGRFMAASLLQSQAWRRLPAVPPLFCLQMCALRGYTYAAVGNSKDPTCDCARTPPTNLLFRVWRSDSDKQVFMLSGLPKAGKMTSVTVMRGSFLQFTFSGTSAARPIVLYLRSAPPAGWTFRLPSGGDSFPQKYRLLAYCPLMCRAQGFPYAAVRFQPAGCSCLGPAEVDAVRSDTSSSPDGASPDSTIQIIQLGSLQGSAFPKELLVLDRTSSGDQWSFSPRWIPISIRLGAGSRGSLELEGQTRSVSVLASGIPIKTPPVFIDAGAAFVPKGFNIRGRLRISRDAGFFTSDLSQLSGQWQTVDAKRNAECPQKCLDAGYSYAAMQTQTKRGWCKCALQLQNIDKYARRDSVKTGDIQVISLRRIGEKQLQVARLAELHRQAAIKAYKMIMQNPKWYRQVTVVSVPRTYGQNIGIASNPASCFKGCATSNFNYAFYTVYGCLCSNDKSDVKVVRPRYRTLKYFAAGRTSLFYIGRVNRLKPSGNVNIYEGPNGFIVAQSLKGRVQTGRFMASSLLQSQAWRRLPAVPPLFCLQMCALRGYTYAAVGNSQHPTCDCSKRSPNEADLFRTAKTDSDRQVFFLKGLPRIGKMSLVYVTENSFLQFIFSGTSAARPIVLYLRSAPPAGWTFRLPSGGDSFPQKYRLLAYCPLMCRAQGFPYAAVRFQPAGCSCLGPAEVDTVRSDTSSSPDGASPDSTIQIIQLGSLQGAAIPKELLVLVRTASGGQWSFSPRWITISIRLGAGSKDFLDLKGLTGTYDGISFRFDVQDNNYYFLFINGAPAPSGFSGSLPSGDWRDLGQRPVSDCLAACARHNLLFMAVRVQGDTTTCWGAPAADLSSLQHSAPDVAGMYQLFSLDGLRVGQKSHFSYGGIVNVISESLANGYERFSIVMKGDSQPSPLVSYFTDTVPGSVRWLPTTFLDSPAECVARCCGLRFSLALVRSSGDRLCLCGDLRAGGDLGLTDTSPPSSAGSMQVVRLPAPPPPAEPDSSVDDGEGGVQHSRIVASWLTPTLCRIIVNGEPARVKFVRLGAVERTKAVDVGPPGDDPGVCISKCMSELKMPAMNKDHCFCLSVGDVELEETLMEGGDVLSVLDITKYVVKPNDAEPKTEEVTIEKKPEPVTKTGTVDIEKKQDSEPKPETIEREPESETETEAVIIEKKPEPEPKPEEVVINKQPDSEPKTEEGTIEKRPDSESKPEEAIEKTPDSEPITEKATIERKPDSEPKPGTIERGPESETETEAVIIEKKPEPEPKPEEVIINKQPDSEPKTEEGTIEKRPDSESKSEEAIEKTPDSEPIPEKGTIERKPDSEPKPGTIERGPESETETEAVIIEKKPEPEPKPEEVIINKQPDSEPKTEEGTIEKRPDSESKPEEAIEKTPDSEPIPEKATIERKPDSVPKPGTIERGPESETETEAVIIEKKPEPEPKPEEVIINKQPDSEPKTEEVTIERKPDSEPKPEKVTIERKPDSEPKPGTIAREPEPETETRTVIIEKKPEPEFKPEDVVDNKQPDSEPKTEEVTIERKPDLEPKPEEAIEKTPDSEPKPEKVTIERKPDSEPKPGTIAREPEPETESRTVIIEKKPEPEPKPEDVVDNKQPDSEPKTEEVTIERKPDSEPKPQEAIEKTPDSESEPEKVTIERKPDSEPKPGTIAREPEPETETKTVIIEKKPEPEPKPRDVVHNKQPDSEPKTEEVTIERKPDSEPKPEEAIEKTPDSEPKPEKVTIERKPDSEPKPGTIAREPEPETETKTVIIEKKPEPEPKPEDVVINKQPDSEPKTEEVTIERKPDSEPKPEEAIEKTPDSEPKPEKVTIERKPDSEPKPGTIAREPEPEPKPEEVVINKQPDSEPKTEEVTIERKPDSEPKSEEAFEKMPDSEPEPERATIERKPDSQTETETDVIEKKPESEPKPEEVVIIKQPDSEPKTEDAAIERKPDSEPEPEKVTIKKKPESETKTKTAIVEKKPESEPKPEVAINKQPDSEPKTEKVTIERKPDSEPKPKEVAIEKTPDSEPKPEKVTIEKTPESHTKTEAAIIEKKPESKARPEEVAISKQPDSEPKTDDSTVERKPDAEPKPEKAAIERKSESKLNPEEVINNKQPDSEPKDEEVTIERKPDSKPKPEKVTIERKPESETKTEAVIIEKKPELKHKPGEVVSNKQTDSVSKCEGVTIKRRPGHGTSLTRKPSYQHTIEDISRSERDSEPRRQIVTLERKPGTGTRSRKTLVRREHGATTPTKTTTVRRKQGSSPRRKMVGFERRPGSSPRRKIVSFERRPGSGRKRKRVTMERRPGSSSVKKHPRTRRRSKNRSGRGFSSVKKHPRTRRRSKNRSGRGSSSVKKHPRTRRRSKNRSGRGSSSIKKHPRTRRRLKNRNGRGSSSVKKHPRTRRRSKNRSGRGSSSVKKHPRTRRRSKNRSGRGSSSVKKHPRTRRRSKNRSGRGSSSVKKHPRTRRRSKNRSGRGSSSVKKHPRTRRRSKNRSGRGSSSVKKHPRTRRRSKNRSGRGSSSVKKHPRTRRRSKNRSGRGSSSVKKHPRTRRRSKNRSGRGSSSVKKHPRTRRRSKNRSGRGISISFELQEHNYYILLISGAPAPSGFSGSLPSGDWRDLGQRPVSDCLAACARHNLLFMAVRVQGDTTTCWGAPAADLSSLQHSAPDVAGMYQLFSLDGLRVGQKSHFSFGGIVDVISEYLANGYERFSIAMAGDSQPSPLVSYFTDTVPGSVRWMPTTFLDSPAECVARCCGLRFSLALVRSSGDRLCLCGDLRAGGDLGLTDTSPPSSAGSMQVVRLPPPPAATGSAAVIGDGVYQSPTIMAQWMTSTLCRVLINNEPADVKFAQLAAVQRSKAVDVGPPGDDPGVCISKCMSELKMPAMNKDHCFCLSVGDVELEETLMEGGDVLSVLDVTKYLPKSYGSEPAQDISTSQSQVDSPASTDISINFQVREHNYYILLINGAPAPSGFSGSLPSGDWRDLGQRPVSDCLAACARHNLLFMAVRVQGDTTACWGAPAADLSSLQHSAPDVAGMYQLFNLEGLRVGQKSHFSYGGIVDVISESLSNGYERFSIAMAGDSQPSPLASYFTDTVPGSVRWLPTTFLDSPAECVARCCGLRFSLALVRSSSDRLCLCGDLRAGGDLGLTDTSPPSSVGSMQVVRLPAPPAATGSGVIGGGDVGGYHAPAIQAEWMTPTLCRILMDNEPAPVKFSRVAALQKVQAVSLDAPGDNPIRCVMECESQFFKWAALNKGHCFCSDLDMALEDRWTEDADVLTVMDTTEYQPKPDGSKLMQIFQNPKTNYFRFIVGNVLQKCGYTAEAVDAAAGPPGQWTAVGAPQQHPAGCAAQCAMQPAGVQPFVAVLPLGPGQYRCWCAPHGDLSKYSGVVPDAPGRAQIYDFTDLIKMMMT
ncbi:uncharacterized protein LOC122392035 isoform X13 [Amphibalanus amphitrite]|uniref:uncharacterized protein LOC122392035 isoform X13 n=1 Tax=Amphibalanus amphitrite TaxID=1232801 RepID=UPI001C903662|nr:uncharacterized protein LOC122392035 isoform X13 [Amphibalanus amphitrite]